MMPLISYLPLNNFVICLPKNKPINDMEKVSTKMIDTCNHIVTLSDKSA